MYFKDLKHGDEFIFAHANHMGDLSMKLKTPKYLICEANAVRLRDGQLMVVADDQEVILECSNK